jgi:hypothetical protein
MLALRYLIFCPIFRTWAVGFCFWMLVLVVNISKVM